MPSKGTKNVNRGYIIPVGGAEEKVNDPDILEKIVELCGGSTGSIAVIPTASKRKSTGKEYVRLFKNMGIGNAKSLFINEREDCFNSKYLDYMETVTGIFITGGNQLRLSTILGGTPIAQSIRLLNADGVHVAGTSAGAAIISEHMIVGGSSGSTPRESGVRLAPGLGLTNALIIDQHFRQRDRIGRLLSAISYNPFAIGVGLDEDTGIFINPDDQFEVIGSGGVTVLDPSNVKYSSMAKIQENKPVTLFGITMHLLASNSLFCIKNRKPSIKP